MKSSGRVIVFNVASIASSGRSVCPVNKNEILLSSHAALPHSVVTDRSNIRAGIY